MKPRVIWLDDDIHAVKLRPTVAKFRNSFDIIECENIDEFRDKSQRLEWDAAILDVLNAALVADGHIVQRGIEQTRVLVYAAGHVEASGEATQLHMAGEACAAYVLQAGGIGNKHIVPVLGAVALGFQSFAFFLCQLS